MDYNTVLAMVRPDLLIIAVVLWCIGMLMKKAPDVPDWTIPFGVAGMGILLTLVYIAVVLGEGFTAPVVVTAFIQGVLVSTLAVYGNEVLKQLTVKRGQDDEDI